MMSSTNRVARPPLAVLTTTSSDSHTWNLMLIQLLLEESGCVVVNLGPCVPPDEVGTAVAELLPDIVVVSTVNGHGCTDAASLPSMNGGGVTKPLFVIGGKLNTRGSLSEEERVGLRQAGYDFVYGDSPSDLASFMELLKSVGAGSLAVAR